MIAWIMANWQKVFLDLLAIDAVLIPIFPSVPFLVMLKNFLSSFVKAE